MLVISAAEGKIILEEPIFFLNLPFHHLQEMVLKRPPNKEAKLLVGVEVFLNTNLLHGH